MAIYLLCTRVRIPDNDEWGKLGRLIRYIRDTLHLTLILSPDSLNVIKWWVDASFAAHPYCKGHTGAMMSMGLISIMELSRKKKINGRISTEAKIVGGDNAFPQCLCLR